MKVREIAPIIGVFGVSVVAVLAFAVATGWIGRHMFGPLPQAEPEEPEPVVAGIGQGSAPVPRWLYVAYILIPLWAVFYMANNLQVKGETQPTPAASGAAAATAAPSAPAGVSKTARISAKNIAYNVKDIKLAAGAGDIITFRNDDQGVPHNVAVYKDAGFTQALFHGPIVTGPGQKDYQLPALTPGAYYFHCDIHPAMQGSLTVA